MRAPAATILHLVLAFAALPAALVATPVSGYKIVAEFPHSTTSYTEGFFFRDGLFYEGTGLKGSSAILVIEPETGKVLQRRDLPQQFFGEGIVDWAMRFMSGPGSLISASSTTDFLFVLPGSSRIPARAGA